MLLLGTGWWFMLFTSKLKSLSVIVVTGSLMVGFQNCAKYSYQDVVAEKNDSLNDTLSSDELPDNTLTPIDQTPPQAGQPIPPKNELPPVAELPPTEQPPSNELPPVPQPPVAELPPVPQPPSNELPPAPQPPVAELPPVPQPPSNELPPVPQPPVAEVPPVVPPIGLPPVTPPEDQECIDWALEKKDKNQDKGKKDQDQNTGKYSKKEDSKNNGQDNGKKSNDKNEKSAGRSSVASDEVLADINCSKKDKEEKLIVKKPRCYVDEDDDNDDEDYDTTCDIRGGQAKFLNSISAALNIIGLRGKFVISPETVGSNSLAKLEDLRGKIIICFMDIDSVKNTRGKVVAYKSNIGVWEDHRGKSVIVDSRIDKCDDHKGKIDIKGSNAVCNSIQNSKGVVNISRNSQ